MIVASLRKSLAAKAAAWAKAKGIAGPSALPLALAPAHVAADVSVPWALQLAKAARENPLELAKALAKEFETVPEVESAGATPPGFVNLKLKGAALTANL